MSFLKIWIHAVWSTDHRKPFLTPNIRWSVFDHIKENGNKKGLYIDRVNGYLDHVHVLLDLPSEIPISKAIQLLKGESSYWVNKNGLIREQFSWQDEYYAASVSESNVMAVRNYIDHQEEHHKKKSFQEEYHELLQEVTANLSAETDT